MRKNLKLARIAAGMTLGDLARATGIGLSTLGNYEKGRTNLSADKLSRVASVLKNDSQHLAQIASEYPVGPVSQEMLMVVAESTLPSVQREISHTLQRVEIELRHMKQLDDDGRSRSVDRAVQAIHDYESFCARECESLRHSRRRVVQSVHNHPQK